MNVFCGLRSLPLDKQAVFRSRGEFLRSLSSYCSYLQGSPARVSHLKAGSLFAPYSSLLANSAPKTSFIANTLLSPDELHASVLSWSVPHTEGPLSEDELKHFFEKGFVIKHGVVPKELLEGAKNAVNDLVNTLANRLMKAKVISRSYEELGLHERLQALEEEYPNAGVLLHKLGVLPPQFQVLWACKPFLDIASQILGQNNDIYGHPVWNLRCKTPDRLSEGQATVPWHQDTSYLDESCWDKLQLTAWVPLLDADENNGCMEVISGGHTSGVTAQHTCCVGGTWYNDLAPEAIEGALGVDMGKAISCPVPFGSVLLLNNLIPHRSLPNLSKQIRWSLDLRWQRGGESNGFEDIKSSILMRRASNKAVPVDWKGWAEENRTDKQQEAVTGEVRAAVENAADQNGSREGDLNSTISGPWMHRWPIVHHNRHTASLGVHGWHA